MVLHLLGNMILYCLVVAMEGMANLDGFHVSKWIVPPALERPIVSTEFMSRHIKIVMASGPFVCVENGLLNSTALDRLLSHCENQDHKTIVLVMKIRINL